MDIGARHLLPVFAMAAILAGGAIIALDREAVAIDPGDLFSESALGDVAAAIGHTQEARAAFESAI